MAAISTLSNTLWDVGTAKLWVETVGEGSRLVLLHGGPGASHDYLRPQLDALGDRHQLVYYDQRACGRSPSDGAAPGWREHVADLEALRVYLGDEKLTLLGYSWGGLLAMLYAVEHPERVARMALLSPAPSTASDRPAARARLVAAGQRPEVAALRQVLAEREGLPPGSTPRERRHRFALAVAGYFANPLLAADLTPFVVQQRVEEAVWKSLEGYDLSMALRGLHIPSLVIHGDEDPIPLDTARRTAEALRAELVILTHCGHVPYVEAPQPTFTALHRFFDV